ncbi:MAG: glycosyltransferase family 39 protein [Alphaproteobacteria bacterium]|nr:glycosyltransferase family 39 protein [Alphaproteobacteria bacterium]
MLMANQKTYRYAAWGVMGILLALVLCTFLDYGITWDEELQSQYGQAVVDYYASGFKDQRYAEIFNLYLYGGMFDGLASVIDHYTPFRVYDTRHLVNALFGLLGLWGVWRLGRLLGGGAVGLTALVLCAATPSYYGHMFNNPKDIPFAAGIIWTLYFMARSYAKPDRRVLAKLGVVLGLTLGVRVGGAMIFAFWLAPMGIEALLPLLKNRDAATWRNVGADILRRAWKIVLPVGAIAYAVMLICWPWAQQHPVTNPLRALGEFSNFPQVVEVMLDGTTYMSTQLPWYYVPLYFGIQLPELLLFLLAASVVFTPWIWRHMTRPQKQGFVAMLLMAGFPILYAMLRHPALYDTVRHFLFAVPIACIVAALAARTLFIWCAGQFHTHAARRVIYIGLTVAFALFIAGQIIIMARLHPYEYIFVNQFAGGVRGAYGRYESDYWGSSFKEAAEAIQAFVARDGGVPPGKIYKIAICGPWDSAMIYMPPDYEPVVANEPAEFFLSTTRWMCQDMRPGKTIITVKRLGVPLAVVKDLRGGYEHYYGNANEKK